MRRIYKLFPSFRIAFYAFCAILITDFCHNPARADDSAFTVQDVRVDITAEDAAVAREKAFAEAQVKAFAELAQRLLPEEQATNFAPPDASVISPMVRDFEITQEKISAVRYIGAYTFRFDKNAVRGFLGSKGVAYSDVSSKPVLVLPFYQWGNRTLLWGGDNPWLEAWKIAPSQRGLVPIVIPIGDAQDIADIGDGEALTYDATRLSAMLGRYGAAEAIILLATPLWGGNNRGAADMAPDSIDIMVYRTDRGSAEFANKLAVRKDQSWDMANIFEAGVTQSRAAMQKAWKNQTVASPAQNNRVKVRVRFASMQEWIETQSSLRRVQGVNEVKLISLKQNEANLELQFQGDEERLRLALAQSDMTLRAPQPAGGGYGAYTTYSAYGAPVAGAANQPYDLFLNKFYNPY